MAGIRKEITAKLRPDLTNSLLKNQDHKEDKN